MFILTNDYFREFMVVLGAIFGTILTSSATQPHFTAEFNAALLFNEQLEMEKRNGGKRSGDKK